MATPRSTALRQGLARRVPWRVKRAVAPLVPDRLMLRVSPPRPLLLAARLDGLSGVEIGGSAHNDYGLDVINVDRWGGEDTVYKAEELRRAGATRAVDVVARGDELPFADGSYDFVFASHVIEHFPDPVGALREWVRVARRYVLLVVPHRDRTFDAGRPLTGADELIARHEAGFSSEEDRHWSVWTCESFVELCRRLDLRVLDWEDPDSRGGNGFAVLIDAGA